GSIHNPQQTRRNFIPFCIRVIRVIRGSFLFGPSASLRDALILELWVRPEIYQQSEFVTSCVQIIMNLCAMLVTEFADCLYLDNDLVETNEVWNISLLQLKFLVVQPEPVLGIEWNAAQSEFERQALLIHRFQEPESHHVVDLKTCTHDLKAL